METEEGPLGNWVNDYDTDVFPEAINSTPLPTAGMVTAPIHLSEYSPSHPQPSATEMSIA